MSEYHLREAETEFENAYAFDVFQKTDHLGVFDFSHDYPGVGPALLYLSTLPKPGRGKSGIVLEAFSDQLGHKVDFDAPDIIHEASWSTFAQLRLLEKAYENGHIMVDHAQILTKIPIVHVLQSGGIKVHSVEMRRRPGDFSLANIYGSLLQGFDNGPKFFDTVIHARTK